jgi:hypothetical protein
LAPKAVAVAVIASPATSSMVMHLKEIVPLRPVFTLSSPRNFSPSPKVEGRERVTEVEEGPEEAYRVRCQLVRLLVGGIKADRHPDGRADIRITYRFGSPAEAVGAGAEFVDGVKNILKYRHGKP